MKILPTIGPATKSKESIKYISKICSLVRLNTSHNKIEWHKQTIKTIKNINKNIDILVDIPGVKPRTNNLTDIHIKKNQIIKLGYKVKNSLNVIDLTKKLPKKSKNISNFFSIDDGKIKFKLISYKKNMIIGKAYDDCIIKPKKGVNIPNSIYDDNSQIKIYKNYINQLSEKNLDAVGLSFIQNKNAIIKLKKKFKKLVMVSKVENTEGLNNVDEICKYSDAVMIDRGDLSAEIGERNLYEAIIKISETAKKFGKPLIMATENLESMFLNKEPSKNDIISLEFSNQINTDIIMLSEETATSKKWKQILNWLNVFIKNKKREFKKKKMRICFGKK